MTGAFGLLVLAAGLVAAFAIGHRTRAPLTTDQHYLAHRDALAARLRTRADDRRHRMRRATGARAADLGREADALDHLAAQVGAFSYNLGVTGSAQPARTEVKR